MANNLMPSWALALLTAAYLVILVLHLRHWREVRGSARVWHGVHVVMAAGMVNMSVPPSWLGLGGMPVPAAPLAAAYAVAASVVGLLVLTGVVRRRGAEWLWVLAVVGLVGMWWMYSYVGSSGGALVTVVLVAWFVVESALWIDGRLLPQVARLGGAVGEGARDGSGVTTAAVDPGEGATLVATEAPVAHGEAHAPQVTLFVMALGMAWMLISMQFGSTSGGGMGGMTHH